MSPEKKHLLDNCFIMQDDGARFVFKLKQCGFLAGSLPYYFPALCFTEILSMSKKIKVIATRRDRLLKALKSVSQLPNASNGLEAYKQISEAINQEEDLMWGKDTWNPPRSFLAGNRTARLYPIYPESFHSLKKYPGIMLLLSKREIVFISRFGAIEIQEKDINDQYGEITPFSERKEKILFSKLDAYNHDIWHDKNKV